MATESYSGGPGLHILHYPLRTILYSPHSSAMCFHIIIFTYSSFKVNNNGTALTGRRKVFELPDCSIPRYV